MPDNPQPLSLSLNVLSKAGREPDLPATVVTEFGELVLRRALRILPERRFTALAVLNQCPVIAKVFFDHPKSVRDARQEAERLVALAERGVPAPRLVGDSGPVAGGRVLVLEHLSGTDAARLYEQAYRNDAGEQWAALLVAFLAKLHRAGCVQDDVHLGNFLIDGDQCYLVDAGSVRLFEPGQVPAADRLANLAALLAQFYPVDTRELAPVVAAYGEGAPSVAELETALGRARQRRYRHALGKVQRDCTDFAVVRHSSLRGMVRRPLRAVFEALLEAGIDRLMAEGEMLKPGNSSTVCRVHWQGRDWVIKRYNVKSAGHRLRKQFKPSRAARSWRNARWLELIGLDTPPAVGYVERRVMGLQDTAYFICEYVSGPSLKDLAGGGSEAMARARQQVARLFFLMETLHFNHGDLKATNFLWVEGRLCILDLDAMQLGLSKGQTARLVARDRKRWAANFQNQHD
ncbi:hypothetical protein A6D6_02861 [Alcanivorax xiamenensis]|uniref:Aminoglycoside phosphotransferase domain-containing protein n=1 Tax=Alcanivorax xiamenensis TaxID=1177156 RepID=A0ABQ6Y5Y3_9GAMM|nr:MULTISPECIES: lipopolysaccharide kinase InaA family protein [Alcanivorax]KAF0804709.1 hypothetical protein A6D6_02861 [Alcanivorax xiamenensis]